MGRLHNWDRRDWPTPVFVRYEELTGRSFRVIYDDDDPNKVLKEEQVAPGEAEQAPKDGPMGIDSPRKYWPGSCADAGADVQCRDAAVGPCLVPLPNG